MPLPQTSPRRILVLFNPAAGGDRRARFNRVLEALRRHACILTVRETTAPGDAEIFAREALPDSFDVLAAAGGDGTINEVVNGLRGKDVVLGLIPLGTANVLADEIGLARDPESVADVLATGPIRNIRLGCANGRRFVMMAGVGFDANVVHGVSLRLKKLIGPLAYVWQAMRQAAVDPFASCDVILDGAPFQAVSVVACNGRRYGGPFIAAPAASLADDCFHVLLMTGRGWFSVLRYGIGLMFGNVTMWRDVTRVSGREMIVRGMPGQPIQADGDIVAVLPARITIDPAPLRVIYPA